MENKKIKKDAQIKASKSSEKIVSLKQRWRDMAINDSGLSRIIIVYCIIPIILVVICVKSYALVEAGLGGIVTMILLSISIYLHHIGML